MENLRISLDEGYWPHVADGFLQRYGSESLFVYAAADVLTARFVSALVKGGRIAAETEPVALGPAEAQQALARLLERLRENGDSESILWLLREFAGVREPGGFQEAVDRMYGSGTFSVWLAFFEAEQYSAADGILSSQR